MMNDEELVEQCRRGIRTAQKTLYERYSPMMLGVCLRYVPRREEAEDVLHDAFVKVFSKLYTLKRSQALEDWVYHIVVNTAISRVRRKRIEIITGDELEAEDMCYEPYDMSALVQAIGELPDGYRLVFNMREVEGYAFEEIAKELGVEVVSVRSTLCRAKKMLQEKLKSYGY